VSSSAYNDLNQVTSVSGSGELSISGSLNEPETVTVAGTVVSTDSNNKFIVLAPVVAGSTSIPITATATGTSRREIAGKRAWKRRLTFQEVVAVVEGQRGESWGEFRDRRGDSGRGMVRWLGRRHAGKMRKELGEKAGRDYAAVWMALKRYELKMKKNPAMRTETQMLERSMLNVEI